MEVIIPGGAEQYMVDVVEALKTSNPDVTVKVYDTRDNPGSEGLWEFTQCDSNEDMVYQAVSQAAKSPKAIIVKGNVQTKDLLKEILKDEHQLKQDRLLSHVAKFEFEDTDRTFLLTDAAMNIAPSVDQLEDIVKNAIEAAQNLGIQQPKVAMLSSAEVFNPKMPSSVIAKEVTERFAGTGHIVFGPLSFDLATSEAAAQKKHFEGPIVGDADIVVVPTIDVGNVLYKSLTVFAHANVGGILVGSKIPVALTSRSDSKDSKLLSIQIALQQLQ